MVSKQSQTQSPFTNSEAQIQQDYGNQDNESCAARILIITPRIFNLTKQCSIL